MSVSSVFLEDQLKFVLNEVVRQDFPEMLMANGTLINISTEINSGATNYSYTILTYLGEAAILGNGVTDIPMVNAFAEERIGRIRTIGDKYSLTVPNLENAQFAGVNISSEMGIACREIIEKKFDVLGYDGDADFNLLGWLNLPNVPLYTVTADGNENGGSNSTRFIHKTGAQMYRDLTEFSRATRTATRGTYKPQYITLPEEAFSAVMETPFPDSQTATSSTVGKFFLEAQRMSMSGVQQLIPADYLADAGTGGTSVMMSHIKNPRFLKYHMPLDFDQRPPTEERDLQYEIVCRLKTGGVQNTKPLTLRKAEGV